MANNLREQNSPCRALISSMALISHNNRETNLTITRNRPLKTIKGVSTTNHEVARRVLENVQSPAIRRLRLRCPVQLPLVTVLTSTVWVSPTANQAT